MRPLALLLLLPPLALCGCIIPTAAQMKVMESEGKARFAISKYQKCLARVAADSSHAILEPHTPLDVQMHPTADELTDTNIPDTAERTAIIAWQDDVEHCRVAVVDEVKEPAPYMIVPINNAAIARLPIYQGWAQGTLSWGDGNQKLEASGHVDLLAVAEAEGDRAILAVTDQRELDEITAWHQTITDVKIGLATAANETLKRMSRQQRRHEEYERYKEEHPEPSHTSSHSTHCTKAHPC